MLAEKSVELVPCYFSLRQPVPDKAPTSLASPVLGAVSVSPLIHGIPSLSASHPPSVSPSVDGAAPWICFIDRERSFFIVGVCGGNSGRKGGRRD